MLIFLYVCLVLMAFAYAYVVLLVGFLDRLAGMGKMTLFDGLLHIVPIVVMTKYVGYYFFGEHVQGSIFDGEVSLFWSVISAAALGLSYLSLKYNGGWIALLRMTIKSGLLMCKQKPRRAILLAMSTSVKRRVVNGFGFVKAEWRQANQEKSITICDIDLTESKPGRTKKGNTLR